MLYGLEKDPEARHNLYITILITPKEARGFDNVYNSFASKPETGSGRGSNQVDKLKDGRLDELTIHLRANQKGTAMRIYLPVFIVVIALLSLGVKPVTTERAPNIIMIYADDLGWKDVGFNGRTEWRTPNLDRLAREGTVFRRWYSGSAVCDPSRAALLTGKYGIHNGVTRNTDDLPSGEVTVARALKELGYVTALFGKWHHGRPRPGKDGYVHPMDHGFDEFFGFTDATHAHEHFPKGLWFGREIRPVKGYADTLFADHSVDFIKRNKDRHFFLYLAFTVPHFNIEAPEEDVAEYKGRFKEKDPTNPLNATYAAMVTRLDKEVGRVIRTLDELGLTRDTLIVFSSDQGATFERGNQGTSAYHDSNRPFRGQKRTLWEGGIRVPGLVRWPGKVPAGKISNEIIHMIDVMPTFLAAAGGRPDPSWKVDGQNMLPVWLGKEKAPERTLFWEWRAEGYYQLAAMHSHLKLVITGNNPPELFNLETDPAERRSIIADYQPLARQLHQELEDWLATEVEESKQGKEKNR